MQRSDENFVQEPEVFQISTAKETYNATYREEIELNAKFRKYILNYKAIVEGENTIKAQVMHSRGIPREERK